MGIAAFGAVSVVACSSNQADDASSEPLARKSAALVGASDEGESVLHAPASSSSTPSMTVDWSGLEGGVSTLGTDASLELVVENHEDEVLSATLVLEISGLGAKRSVDLGQLTLSPREVQRVSWSPGSSPIAPIGSLARVVPRISYTRADVAVRLPGRQLYLAFAADGHQLFVSESNGNGVRLASMGQSTSRAVAGGGDVATLLTSLGNRRGQVDGRRVDSTPSLLKMAAPAGASAGESNADEFIGDSVSYPESEAPTSSVVANGIGGGPVIVIPPICMNKQTIPVCSRWRTNGFTDLGGGIGVVPVDYDLSSAPAAYANATFYSDNDVMWQGTLDANGCTPSVTFCSNRTLRVDVSASSLQKPAVTINNTVLFPASRQVNISPSRTFSATVTLAQTIPSGSYIANAQLWASNQPDDYVVRTAAVLGRILSMPDNGFPTSSAPALAVHTENGCMLDATRCDPRLSYGSTVYDKLCGEACGRANDVWYGPSLSAVGGLHPTGHHTTESAYSIAHEIGHSVQFSAGADPANRKEYDEDRGTGLCGCEHVTDGNRLHCLQSSHEQANANIEGFAQFYSTRAMNDQGGDAQFSYYKTFRRMTYGANGSLTQTMLAPPVAISVGAPFTTPYTTGWVRNYCNEAGHSSEYDWLTFLWGVNGKPTSSRPTMSELLSILSSARSNFGWSAFADATTAQYPPNSVKISTIMNAATLHGVNL
ncbi:hypothetical protein [Labilithrix luteola]|uniref:hypothetical protein n=1 Tax=Labilithrix luteola TaxID=1391654 RepID=UPI0011BA6D96|nr:hypothetical protein [Labilithrix luteola]